MKMTIALIMLITAGTLLAGNKESAGDKRNTKQTIPNSKMSLISEGYYIPLYSSEKDEKQKVESFYLDVYPVTNEEFLSFVKANTKWSRSSVKSLFADNKYLANWKNDFELGTEVDPSAPVTFVSWFAAKAYAQWVGKRLPTTAEWEYVASASLTKPNAYDDEKNLDRIRGWYAAQSTKKINKVGSTEKNYWKVYDLFGLIWEWTYDFNTALVTGESRENGSLNTNLFCGSGSSNATDLKNYPGFMRSALRSSLKAKYTVHNLGFRCAKDIK